MTNDLSNSSSPYLLQHANQPVHWKVWGESVFEEAKRRDCPVFLSIGYATCHWCHVMARESFDDPEIARILNAGFVSVKVDREEYPDLDRAAMQVCQMVHGHGGWPLHLVLTPEKRPFFAATYLPKENRFGQQGLTGTLHSLLHHWETDRDRVFQAAETIEHGYRSMLDPTPGDGIDRNQIRQATCQWIESFDSRFGGFGQPPKFPMGHSLLFLLETGSVYPDTPYLSHALYTIEQIMRGGITDQLEGGIHRYATDREWRLPHFEKMLYDQALWLLVVSEAYRQHRSPLYLQNLERTIDYLEARLLSREGAYYCGEDADSDGEEGTLYLWQYAEVSEILSDNQLESFLQTYNVTRTGNIIPEGKTEPDGRNVLYRKPLPPSDDSLPDLHPPFPRTDWETKLRNVRAERTRPQLDDKILTDWNALAIAGLARAGTVTGRSSWINQAIQSACTLRSHLLDKDGRWLHRYRNGQAGIAATSNDYAALLWGWLELYNATFDPVWLEEAVIWGRDWISDFTDERTGAFFLCRYGNDPLFENQKPIDDGALPSCNSIAIHQLIRLGMLTGDTEWLNRANRILDWASGATLSWPNGHLHTLHAQALAQEPHVMVVVTGEDHCESTDQMVHHIHRSSGPTRWAALLTPMRRKTMIQVAPWMETLPQTEEATAWICNQTHCEERLTDADQLAERLQRL